MLHNELLFLYIWAPLHHFFLFLDHLFEGVPVKHSEISQRWFDHPSHHFWYQCYAVQTDFFCLKKKSEKKSYFYSLVASTLLCGENLDTFSWVAFLLDLALFSPKILGSMLISNASVKSQERAVLRALYVNNLKILREILYLLSSQKHHASPNKNRFVMIQ